MFSIRSQRSSLAWLLVGASSLALMSGCSKSAKTDTSGTPETAKTEPTDKSGHTDLEEAIKAPGDKKVTAIGANGEEKVMPVGGTKLAETPTYLVQATLPESTAKGTAAFVTINVTPKTGWKINQEFPTKLTVQAPSGVKLEKESQGIKEAETFSEKIATFKVAFNPETAGPKAFAANFSFAVCTDATCDPKEATLAWTVAVSE